MAEIANSDSPSPFASSSPAPFSDDISAQLDDFLSDASSILDDTDLEEGHSDDDISIDPVEEDDDDSDRDSNNGDGDVDVDVDVDVDEEEEDDEEDDEIDVENEEDYLFDDDDFDDFDFDDMREVGLDFDEFGFLGDERPGPGDYFDFPDEQEIDALHHVFLHELEHHLAQEPWALRPHSPLMDNLGGGLGGRGRMHQDELVRVEMAGPLNGNAGGRNSANGGGNNNNGGGAAGAGAGAGGQRRIRQPFPEFIDLTGEDDADLPAQLHSANQSNHPARSIPHRQSENQRRLRSQSQNIPPRLNRSDGSYIDNQHVIVLSSSDDEDQPMRNIPRRGVHNNRHNHLNNHSHNHNLNHNLNHNHNHNHQHNHQHNHRYNENNFADRGARNARFGDQLRQPGLGSAQDQNQNGRLDPFTQLIQNIPLFQLLRNTPPGVMAHRNQNGDDDIVITGERNINNLPNSPGLIPIAGQRQLFELGPIQLDYGGRAFHGQPMAPPAFAAAAAAAAAAAGPPKPVHEPPKPARPGFTRDTGEDVVAICPSCDQELAYDPEGDDDASTPAKKSRSKKATKATAEHHFWAVKACGHVYCKRCFDNRRASAKSTVHVSFRPEGNGGKKIFCAVEDCESDVSAKGAWVGIFM
ncbi:hypothetical protein ONZ43_g475 [Nemania bipapillata]|uniref:Uncharacterized protein n=1 Tax=Nemania bipapillata TaxID=110536 RepID=A0ACC2J807_9PEZI|nr:hypothetical protein ONZ43_g475 [Nemania bipapillata]